MILSKVIDALNLEIEAEPDYFPIFGRFIAQHRADLPAPAPAWLGLDRFAWGGEHIEVSRLTVPVDLVGQDLWLLAEDHGKFRRSEEHTSELQSTNAHLVCRLLLEKKNK